MEEKLSFEQILESEKEEIEKSILEKNADTIPQDKEVEDKKNLITGKSKFDMIIDLQNLEKTLGMEITDEKKLKRWTKAELAKRIGDLLSGAIKKTEIGEPVKEEISQNSPSPDFANDVNLCANALYRMNLMISGLLENTSILLKDHTGDVPVLQGFCGKIEEQKPLMLDVFKDIYLKYKDEIKPYVSPMAQYGFIMTTSAMAVASENIKKKKTEFIEK